MKFFNISLIGLGLAATLFPSLVRAEAQSDIAHLPASLQPVPRTEASHRARHEAFNAQAREGGFEVLFIGDSITQGWEKEGKTAWDAHIAPLRAANFGISGDRTEHVLWRLENGNLEGKINPKAIVLMIGTNNTGHRSDKPDDICAGVVAIVKKLTQRFPEAKLLVLAIFPRGEKPNAAARLNNEAANAAIASAFADKNTWKNVKTLDLSSVFLESDGTLSPAVMPDFLHLSEAGYDRWAEALVPELKQMLGQQP